MPGTPPMLRIALVGAGRMGKSIMRQVAVADDLQLIGVCVRQESVELARQATLDTGLSNAPRIVCSPAEIVGEADVVIDFSLPIATPAVLEAVLSARKPLVSGVTGLDAATFAAVQEASKTIPLLYDRNMSIGIAVLQRLLQQAAKSLGSGFVASVAETHHVHKVDAPSGTALKLGETVAKSRGQEFADVYRYDPGGACERSSAADIVFHVSREGEIPGEHTVAFASEVESIELSHKVTNRSVFAQGALRAARWLAEKPPGFYQIGDLAKSCD